MVVSTGSTTALHSQDSSVVEPVVAELVEASKPPFSLAFSCGRFDRLNDRASLTGLAGG